ncbi:hypothetical protein [Clostridium sp. AWRP]|uniref:hypothetical protein n=1 Tax=Clostridium sp. AWRP TaxID=2212991 RepID=UPI000FDCA16F|nr:hypothetical protein [Clostridium sp. AWRP]AZV56057.1 hypothetical protein DMR38_05295 [Clostridium sp. AWRP]
MRRHFRKKYRKCRKEMKADLRVIMKNNLELSMLIQKIYITYYQRRMLHKIWYVLDTKYTDIYKNEFCGENGLVGKMLCGNWDEFFTNMYFIDRAFYEKYSRRIPEEAALGDAYAVAISYMKSL